jgi:hypothetical protein
MILPGKILISQVNDAQLWMNVNLEKKVTPAFSVLFTEEIRMYENITEIGTVFSELGASYRFDKRFKVAATFRFTNKKRVDDSYDSRQRYYFDFIYREKLKPLIVSVRMRFQSEYKEYTTSPEGRMPGNHLVPKLTLKFDPGKRHLFYIYGEPYFRLNRIVYGSCDQIRTCAGLEYSFNRMHMIDLHYMIEKEFNVIHPETKYVTGIGYYFTF